MPPLALLLRGIIAAGTALPRFSSSQQLCNLGVACFGGQNSRRAAKDILRNGCASSQQLLRRGEEAVVCRSVQWGCPALISCAMQGSRWGSLRRRLRPWLLFSKAPNKIPAAATQE